MADRLAASGATSGTVLMRSDAAAAAVGICYYQWKFGDEAYSCKGSAVRLCNWQGNKIGGM